MPLTLEEHRERLARFVVRVRRVLASPLAQDDEQLKNAHVVHLGITTDGRTVVSDWLPDEAALESLAARLRPLLLKGDPVHYANACASMGAILRQTSRDEATKIANVRITRKAWQAVENRDRGRYVIFSMDPPPGPGVKEQNASTATNDPTNPSSTAATPKDDLTLADGIAAVEAPSLSPTQQWRDRDAADGWFYADLLHADQDRQAEIGDLDLADRVHAAFGFVADVVHLCWRTLGIIWLYRLDLDLPTGAWNSPVGVEPGWRQREGEAYLGPAQTEDGDGEPGGPWQRVGPDSADFTRLAADSEGADAAADREDGIKLRPARDA